ncbi:MULTISPECIES: hypothetical protein [unclassified Nocardia]|uniref:hypothetical protein n=1 Tax=unclassified Nocardia TaxID=2637762 RepID=UPI001CE44CCA|nr:MULTISPECIES: hypothetical protein [unclassified Nocardia]
MEDVVTQPVSTAPVKWKLALVGFAGLYPVVTLVSMLVGMIVPDWIVPARTLLVVLVVVPIMTYLVTPAVHRRVGGWLHRTAGAKAARPEVNSRR